MISEKAILKAFPSAHPDAVKEFVRLAKDDESHLGVQTAMDIANDMLGGHGVEAIQPEWAWVDGYWREAIAIYVNNGETYQETILYDTENERYLITSWGDFYEKWESRNPDPNAPEPEPDEEEAPWRQWEPES